MKKFLFLSAMATLLLSGSDCSRKESGLCKGRLEIKGICMNYTIALLEGDPGKPVTAGWTDETTGKQYTNVFRLGSPCTFPAELKEGDEFYFTVDSSSVQNCAVCMAYYPTPPDRISIKVTTAK